MRKPIGYVTIESMQTLTQEDFIRLEYTGFFALRTAASDEINSIATSQDTGLVWNSLVRDVDVRTPVRLLISRRYHEFTELYLEHV